MIKTIVEVILVGLLLVFFLTDFPKQAAYVHNESSQEVADKIPKLKHFSGRGMWIWNEIRMNKNGVEPFVEKARNNGLEYVVIKAFDGCEWGVPDYNKKKTFQTQLDQSVITAFHEAGIKCYAFGTAWLYPQSNIKEAARHAINTLHKTSADGIIFDDVFAYGEDAKQTEKLFSTVRHHMDSCERCGKKTLAFSTFPSIWRKELPWHIPLKYADCYMPQIYWQAMKKTPEELVKKFQDSWQEYRESHKNIRSEIVMVMPMTGENVTQEQIMQFVSSARQAGYEDLSFFHWSSASDKDWQKIKKKEI